MAEIESAPPSGGVAGALVGTRDFLVAAQAEMKKVTWPTRDELVKATRMIVIFSVALGITIGLVDLVLQLIFVTGIASLAR